MLVLSRKQGQKIHLGTDVTLTVVAVRGNQVRLSIEAPEQVSIRRGELVGARRTPAADWLPADERQGRMALAGAA
jgi:carbon storage regulator